MTVSLGFFVQIPDILEMIKPKLEMIGFKNVSCIAGKAETLNSVPFPFLPNPLCQPNKISFSTQFHYLQWKISKY